MPRIITVGAAQLGAIARNATRVQVVQRMLELMRQAKSHGCDLIVYPELCLTTFFPRWHFEAQSDIDAWFEREMPSKETAPLFEAAKKFGMAFKIGYAELTEEQGKTRRFNTAILVDKAGTIALKYRKVHLPGHDSHEPWRAFQHLEKRYFEVGNLGFPVARTLGGIFGLCICNDRRWPETYRVMGLQGVEMVCLGYNSPEHHPVAPEHDHLGYFHNTICMQSGAYQNGTWVVGVAKAGVEENCKLIGGTQIIAPSGETVAMATTLGDELIVARCDLDHTKSYKETIFNFAKHRRIEAYGLITSQTGVVLPKG